MRRAAMIIGIGLLIPAGVIGAVSFMNKSWDVGVILSCAAFVLLAGIVFARGDIFLEGNSMGIIPIVLGIVLGAGGWVYLNFIQTGGSLAGISFITWTAFGLAFFGVMDAVDA